MSQALQLLVPTCGETHLCARDSELGANDNLAALARAAEGLVDVRADAVPAVGELKADDDEWLVRASGSFRRVAPADLRDTEHEWVRGGRVLLLDPFHARALRLVHFALVAGPESESN